MIEHEEEGGTAAAATDAHSFFSRTIDRNPNNKTHSAHIALINSIAITIIMTA